ncbi:GLPGLI family protein [Flavobacterium sp.]|uniref:GLPGLI family protein n=1 Tax=Flavobacterium sp. TaxID=239 RepID=UPI003F698A6A
MKYNLIVLLLFFTLSNFSQNEAVIGQIEYVTILKLGIPVSSTSKLYFSDSKSLFIQGEYNADKSKSDLEIIKMETDSLQDKIYFNLQKKELVCKTLLDNDLYVVKENLKDDWELLDEEKEILGYNCFKATGNFRGRIYTVWYTTDIPVGIGPWKLNNLPGVVLEAYDITGSVQFKATNITLSFNNKENPELFNYEDINSKTVELKEFVSLKKAYEEELIKKIASKFPKEMKVSSFTKAGKESNLEISYEWED